MNELTEVSAPALPATVSSNDLIFSPVSMGLMNDIAQVMAQGVATVPKHLQKHPSDCLAVVLQAAQWGMNPFAVAQKTHLVSGVLGYEAQLVNAVVSSSTAIEGRFNYEYSEVFKDDMDKSAWVRVGAILKGEDSIQWGEKLCPADVKVKNSPLWKTNPRQQASYLALKYWARLYTPAVILGVYTRDELQEIQADEKEINPAGTTIKEQMTKSTGDDLDNFNDDPDEEVKPAFEDIDKVLRGIAKAETMDDLKKVGQYASNVEGKHLNTARQAYSARSKEIQAPVAEVEPEPASNKDAPDVDSQKQTDDRNDDFREALDSVDGTE